MYGEKPRDAGLKNFRAGITHQRKFINMLIAYNVNNNHSQFYSYITTTHIPKRRIYEATGIHRGDRNKKIPGVDNGRRPGSITYQTTKSSL